MRELICFGFLFLLSPKIATALEWARQFAGRQSGCGDDVVLGIKVSSTGVYATGVYCNIVIPYGFLRKFDFEGNLLWEATSGQFGLSVASDQTGVYAAGGESSSSGFLQKYDPMGVPLWRRLAGSTPGDIVNGVAVGGANVYIAAKIDGLPAIQTYDLNGNLQWTRQVSASAGDDATTVTVHGSSVYVGGRTGSAGVYLRKYDLTGGLVWTRQFDAPQTVQPSVSADAAGVYIVGSTAGVLPGQTSLGGSNDAFILKYDFNGDVLWTHQFGTPNSDLAFDVAGDGSNVYVVGGTIKFLNQTSINGFVQRYDASGNLLSSQQMGPGDYDTARAVAVSGGEVYIGGETKGTFPGQVRFSNDAFLVRLEMGSPPPLKFVPTTPCRIVDTRPGQGTTGGFGPPVLQPGVRAFALPAGRCTVPPDARAYSLNVTVVPLEPLAFLTLWPYGHSQPLVSTLNSFHGGVVANAAIVRAGLNGAISVYATNRTDLVIDINGYFIAETVPQGHSFYTVDPCRLVDTRNPAGAFGGPALTAGGTRNFSVPGGSCRIPSWATAYSVNATVVPALALHYLTLWPGGQIQPFVSTLNSFDGTVVANAAIVQAGNAGDVSAFTTNATELILDTNGFFGPSGNPGDLRFYPLFPCRVADTRTDVGAALLRAGDTREFVVQGKCNVPVTAKAYAMNVTVAPSGPLGYLTLWPSGTGRPLVSTLNSFLGRVVANAALAPAGLSGTMSVFVTNDTHVILDINGYFQ